MRGNIVQYLDNKSIQNAMAVDVDSSSDSVIYMTSNNISNQNGINHKELDFIKTSPWDLGRYAIKY